MAGVQAAAIGGRVEILGPECHLRGECFRRRFVCWGNIKSVQPQVGGLVGGSATLDSPAAFEVHTLHTCT